jgi:APA family basic amino acid/polyamine antiporter
MKETGLKKEIGLMEAMTMVIGVVIGSGIFFKASIVFSHAENPFLGIMAWILGGIITMASALTVTEIATAIPKTGGVFAYLNELYGGKTAFLFGWMQSLIYVPGVVAALSIVLVSQMTFFVDISPTMQKILAIMFIFFIIFINVLSTKLGSKVQLVSTGAKLIPIFAIIGYGLFKGTAQGFDAIMIGASNLSSQSVNYTGLGAAILGTLWAYDGWVGVGNMAGEMRNPTKDLPKAIILGLLTTIAVYIAINVALINVMPLGAIIASEQVTSDAAVILFGKIGASIIAGGIIISIFGALNGYLMTGVRVPFAMAQSGLMPFSKKIGRVDPRFGTPTNAFLFQGTLASIYVLSGSFETLTNLAMFMVWVFFVMTVAGIFILRKSTADKPRSYSVPLYPFVPLVGILGGIYVIISTLMTHLSSSLIGILITLLGLPVYKILIKNKQATSQLTEVAD